MAAVTLFFYQLQIQCPALDIGRDSIACGAILLHSYSRHRIIIDEYVEGFQGEKNLHSILPIFCLSSAILLNA